MTENNPIGNRIHVVGTTGSGKTYIAKKISGILGIEHVELDAIHWGPNWSKPTSSEFRVKVKAALQKNTWVVDGNYSEVRDIIWQRLNTLVWLDYSLFTIMSQLIRRTLKRSINREILWSGNRESLLMAFFSRDSILLYALQTYKRRRKRYQSLLYNPQNNQFSSMRLRSPNETNTWLAKLELI